MGEVARSMGGTLTAPPVDPTQIRRYFGDSKRFRSLDKVIMILTKGVPVPVATSRAELDRSLLYGSHRSATEHLPAILENISDDAWREK